MAVFKDEKEFVEARAINLEFLAAGFVSDVAFLAVVADLESFERDFLRFNFIVAAGFGEAWILIFVCIDQRLDTANDILCETLQILAGLREFGFELLEFFAVSVDVEE